jgi:hypothetical protein
MRTVFVVPLMFTRNDFAEIDPNPPDDYEAKSEEFWNYVSDKLRAPVNIQKMYFDSLTKEKLQETLKFIRSSNDRAYNLVERFKEAGAELQVTEDSILIEETTAWARMLKENNTSGSTQELFAQSMVDREKCVAKLIGESLKDGEMAILFLSPGRRTGDYLPSDIRVIKIQPFDPVDYLNSWFVSLNLKSKTPIAKQ